MAGAELKFSKFLFTDDNGDPLVFFMRPSKEKSKIKPLVERGGGVMTVKVMKNCIKLASKYDQISTTDYVSTLYIKDCCEANMLLDTSLYMLPLKKATNSGDHDSEENVSDDDLSPAKVIITAGRNIQGRSHYTVEEDLAIIKYVVENPHKDVMGRVIWEDMFRREVTKHPAQSMNDRFRRRILPNAHKYDISNEWKFILTHDTKYLKDTPKKRTIPKQKEPFSKFPEFDFSTSNDSANNVDKSGNHTIVDNSVGRAPEDVANSQAGSDSTDDFDKELLSTAAVQSSSPPHQQTPTEREPVPMECQIHHSEHKTSPSTSTRKQTKQKGIRQSPSLLGNLQAVCTQQPSPDSPERSHRRKTTSRQNLKNVQSPRKQPLDGNTENVQDPNLQRNCELFKDLAKTYKMKLEEVAFALFMNNGCVQNTIEWILTGKNLSDREPWDIEDDKILLQKSPKQQMYLKRKYSQKEISDRLEFLNT